jgi:hypothetical protein
MVVKREVEAEEDEELVVDALRVRRCDIKFVSRGRGSSESGVE